MTSMATLNEITKHAKVRNLSLRIPLCTLNVCYGAILNSLFGNDLSVRSVLIQLLETALKNLYMVVEYLQKIYNKRRQAAITNEFLGIIYISIYILYWCLN